MYASRTLEKSGVHDMFQHSSGVLAAEFLGIMVTASNFHCSGQFMDHIARLYILVRGIASKSQYFITSCWKISPAILDLGFLQFLSVLLNLVRFKKRI